MPSVQDRPPFYQAYRHRTMEIVTPLGTVWQHTQELIRCRTKTAEQGSPTGLKMGGETGKSHRRNVYLVVALQSGITVGDIVLWTMSSPSVCGKYPNYLGEDIKSLTMMLFVIQALYCRHLAAQA